MAAQMAMNDDFGNALGGVLYALLDGLGLAQSAAIYDTHACNGSVARSTTHANARRRRASGPGSVQER